MTKTEKLEKYLIKETDTTLEEIEAAYKDRIYQNEKYEEWLLKTAEANDYKDAE
jgi:hypothetical protein